MPGMSLEGEMLCLTGIFPPPCAFSGVRGPGRSSWRTMAASRGGGQAPGLVMAAAAPGWPAGRRPAADSLPAVPPCPHGRSPLRAVTAA